MFFYKNRKQTEKTCRKTMFLLYLQNKYLDLSPQFLVHEIFYRCRFSLPFIQCLQTERYQPRKGP